MKIYEILRKGYVYICINITKIYRNSLIIAYIMDKISNNDVLKIRNTSRRLNVIEVSTMYRKNNGVS